MSGWLQRLTSVMLSLSVLASVAPVRQVRAEEPPPEAQEANAKAIELSKAGDYQGALDLFQRAYDLSPSYIILYNIAKTSRLTRDYGRSLLNYQRYLKEGGADIKPERVKEVEEEIGTLKTLCGFLTVRAEAGARVLFDGIDVGAAPVERLPISPGIHTISLLKDDKLVKKEITVRASDVLSIDLAFETAKVEAPASGDAFEFPSALVPVAWIATGVFAAGTAVTGAFALVISSDLEDDYYVGPARIPAEDSTIASKSDRAKALSIASDVFLTFTIVSATAAIGFTVADAFSSGETPTTTGSPPPKTSVRVGPGSLILEREF